MNVCHSDDVASQFTINNSLMLNSLGNFLSRCDVNINHIVWWQIFDHGFLLSFTRENDMVSISRSVSPIELNLISRLMVRV